MLLHKLNLNESHDDPKIKLRLNRKKVNFRILIRNFSLFTFKEL